ncbi:hypothetical protein KCU88_g6933, partial [Aureobasidium melanogenum]
MSKKRKKRGQTRRKPDADAAADDAEYRERSTNSRKKSQPHIPEPAESFIAEVEEMTKKIQQTYFESSYVPVQLGMIDFFRASRECRDLIYRHLLVPPSKSITFPDPNAQPSTNATKPRVRTSILLLNSQVYREATKILYGETTFIAAHPSHLFLPNGLQGLRRRTTKFINHLSFIKQGTVVDLCMENSQTIYTPIWKTILDYPGFLSLKKLTIRREVLRPAKLDLVRSQELTACQEEGEEEDVDPTTVYNEDRMVVETAAILAFKAASRGLIFEGLDYVQEEEQRMDAGGALLVANVVEVCLTKEDASEDSLGAENLETALTDMLFSGDHPELGDPDKAYRRYLKRCGHD